MLFRTKTIFLVLNVIYISTEGIVNCEDRA
jgi:hypothetical protein